MIRSDRSKVEMPAPEDLMAEMVRENVRFGRLVGPVVTTTSPGMVVRIAGWQLLLSPIIAFAVQRLFLP